MHGHLWPPPVSPTDSCIPALQHDSFLPALLQHDEAVSQVAREAASRGEVVRYVGVVDVVKGQCGVTLQRCARATPSTTLPTSPLLPPPSYVMLPLRG